MVTLVDLHGTCCTLTPNTTPKARLEELAARLPSVGVTALGGFPFKETPDDRFTWNGHDVTEGWLQEQIQEALGLSAVLTYVNPRNLSLHDLGTICKDRGHTWGMHWITLSMVFARHNNKVQLAFARDTRFRLSWCVETAETDVFVATAGLKEWIDYTSHRDDTSFDVHTRRAMSEAHGMLQELISNG